jgi:hypothetical protein
VSIFFIQVFLRLSGSVAAKEHIAQRLDEGRQSISGERTEIQHLLQNDPIMQTHDTLQQCGAA